LGKDTDKKDVTQRGKGFNSWFGKVRREDAQAKGQKVGVKLKRKRKLPGFRVQVNTMSSESNWGKKGKKRERGMRL